MKKNISLILLLSLCLSIVGCVPMRTIKGDGNVVTEKIEIKDYDSFASYGGKMEVNYSQSTDQPELTITTDKNILDIYLFEMEGSRLVIKPQKKYRRSYRIRPTVFTVVTNSGKIKEFDLSGETHLNIKTPILTEKLKLSIAGSGHANLPERVEAQEIETDLAGSGTIDAAAIFCQKYDGDIAGSGTLLLGGEAENVKLSIAGSGDVKAFNLNAKALTTSIAGRGDVEMSVSEKIKVDIAGKGSVRYKGNPTDVSKSIAGSGSLEKVD